MSTAQPTHPGQEAENPAGLTLNLASNNPFRNRTTSPVTGSSHPNTPASPFDDPPPRPVSRNPFLDPANQSNSPLRSPGAMSTQSDPKISSSPTAEELFDSLTIEDPPAPKPENKDTTDEKKPGVPAAGGPTGPPGSRGGHGPRRGGGPPMHHRPTRSQEEAMRARRMPGGPRGGPSGSPHKRGEQRRRNSESSLADPEKPMTEEEKKAREARRREREKRHREAKDRTRRPNRRLDVIDQLDATSIFGTGLHHHDGPYDALNPHRNRTGSRRAPMRAFPKDSLNNAIGGSGPVNKRPDHATFMGNADGEAFKDYAAGGKIKNGYNFPNDSRGELPVFDPMSRGSIMHGDETLGLGTSTFLEGTPATLTAIQRREAEQAADHADGGLQRQKSLAQRIRSIKRPQREFVSSGRLTNPEGVYAARKSPDALPPATSTGGERTGEANPFFAEFSQEPEAITVRKADGSNPKSPTSPGTRPRGISGGLDRRATSDAVSPTGEKPSGGLLARVKSLKGGRKAKNQAETSGEPHPTPAPGSAV